jgi:hypothetical protein
MTAPDSYCRREPTRRFEDLWDFFFVLDLIVEFQFHDLPKLSGLGSIHSQHQRSLQKQILDVLQIGIERYDAFTAGLVSVANKFMYHALRFQLWLDENVSQSFERP